jgi:hypothetical protein
MRNLIALLISLALTVPVYAEPPADHDGSGTQSYTLDWSTMVEETNPSSARYRLTIGEGTPGSWTSWNDPWNDVPVSMPAEEDDITLELEVTDKAGNTNDYTTSALVIPYDSGTASTCPSGTYLFAWDGNHGDGTNYGCDGSGTAVEGTAYGSPTISTDYGGGGSDKGMLVDAAPTYIGFPDSAGALLDMATPQTIWMRVYFSEAPATHTRIFNAQDSEFNDYVRWQAQSNREFLTIYAAEGGTTQTVYSNNLLSTETWIDIAYSWDQANNDHANNVGSSWKQDANELTTAPTDDVELIMIGSNTGFGMTTDYRITKFAIVDGYQSAKPW